MNNSKKEYYYLDLNIITLALVRWGISKTATLTGETESKDIHRIFLTKGQYYKLIKQLSGIVV